jgi:hypothetical protein
MLPTVFIFGSCLSSVSRSHVELLSDGLPRATPAHGAVFKYRARHVLELLFEDFFGIMNM